MNKGQALYSATVSKLSGLAAWQVVVLCEWQVLRRACAAPVAKAIEQRSRVAKCERPPFAQVELCVFMHAHPPLLPPLLPLLNGMRPDSELQKGGWGPLV